MIINRGAAEVDNHILRDDFSTSTLSRMVYNIYFIIPNVIPLFSNHGARVPKTTQCVIATNDFIIFPKRVVFVNSLNAQTGRDSRLNKSCHNH